MDNYALQTAAHLYMMTARELGWPSRPIYWFYPDIHRWDRGEDDRLTIPALIVFYINPLSPLSQEGRLVFQRKVRTIIPGPLKFDYKRVPGAVCVERQPESIQVHQGANDFLVMPMVTHEPLPLRGFLRRLFDASGAKTRAPEAPTAASRPGIAMRQLRKALPKPGRSR